MATQTTLELTLDGKTDFATLSGFDSWSTQQDSDTGTYGWLGYLSIYNETDDDTLITTTLLDGVNWNIAALRFGAAYENKAIITDQDDGANRDIAYLKLGNNSDVDLISTRVRFIEGGYGDLHDVTLGSANTKAIALSATTNIVTTGSGYVGSISTFGDDTVTIGSGGARMVEVGSGESANTNIVTTGSGYVGSIFTYGDDTITIGSGGAGMVDAGGGDNVITTTSDYVSAIVITGTGTNTVDLGSAGVESLRLSKGTNTVDTGSGNVTSIFAYSGATNNITVGTGTVDQIRFSQGTHSITSTAGETGDQGYIGSILVYGSGETNVTLGNAGASSIRLSGGSDTVETGSGWVGQITTGGGEDTITIGSGGIQMLHSGGGDDVITVNGSFESILAGYGDDTITLTNLSWNLESSSAPSVNGGAGSDRFVVGSYADTDASVVIDGGYGSGTIDIVDLSGYTTDLSVTLANDAQWQDLGAGWVTLLGIEGLIGGSGNDVLTGASSGSNQNSLLYGGAGNDKLYGGSGNDRSYGQAGNDSLYMDAGNDTLDGGSGTDWLYVTGSTNSVVNLAKTTGQNTGYGTDIIKNIENASGGSGVDKFYGTTGNNTLKGNNGNDILDGQNGNDVLYGGNNNDKLYGGNNNDKLYGGSGNDLLKGDAGNDLLQGDAGKDTMFGGAGADTFVFRSTTHSSASASGADIIRDFTRGVDKIDLHFIDASTKLSGNNAFTFDGTTSFGTSNQGDIYYKQFNNAGTSNDYTMVYIDTDNDSGTEMSIKLMGLHTLTASDFIL